MGKVNGHTNMLLRPHNLHFRNTTDKSMKPAMYDKLLINKMSYF